MQEENFQIIDCGMLDYSEAVGLQMKMWQNRLDEKTCNTVLLTEHHDVITLGARKTENKLITSESELADRYIHLEKVGRGGGTTAHNPGQIVIYPIIKLKSIGLNVTEYIRSLEAVGVELLKELGVDSQRRKGYPGLWISEKKIASIGVQIRKWVTLHGMAINIQNDLSIFDNIVPCGIDGVKMTSVHEETSKEWPMGEVKQILTELCSRAWGQVNDTGSDQDGC